MWSRRHVEVNFARVGRWTRVPLLPNAVIKSFLSRTTSQVHTHGNDNFNEGVASIKLSLAQCHVQALESGSRQNQLNRGVRKGLIMGEIAR